MNVLLDTTMGIGSASENDYAGPYSQIPGCINNKHILVPRKDIHGIAHSEYTAQRDVDMLLDSLEIDRSLLTSVDTKESLLRITLRVIETPSKDAYTTNMVMRLKHQIEYYGDLFIDSKEQKEIQ